MQIRTTRKTGFWPYANKIVSRLFAEEHPKTSSVHNNNVQKPHVFK